MKEIKHELRSMGAVIEDRKRTLDDLLPESGDPSDIPERDLIDPHWLLDFQNAISTLLNQQISLAKTVYDYGCFQRRKAVGFMDEQIRHEEAFAASAEGSVEEIPPEVWDRWAREVENQVVIAQQKLTESCDDARTTVEIYRLVVNAIENLLNDRCSRLEEHSTVLFCVQLGYSWLTGVEDKILETDTIP